MPRERQFYSEDVREEIRRRHAAGETLPELSRRTGIRFGTVKSMIQEPQRAAAKLAKHQELEGRLFRATFALLDQECLNIDSAPKGEG